MIFGEICYFVGFFFWGSIVLRVVLLWVRGCFGVIFFYFYIFGNEFFLGVVGVLWGVLVGVVFVGEGFLRVVWEESGREVLFRGGFFGVGDIIVLGCVVRKGLFRV